MTTPQQDGPQLRAWLAQLAALRIVKFRENRAELTDAIVMSIRVAAGWSEADARACAAEVAAEALSWTPDQLLEQMHAQLNATDGQARQTGAATVQAEVTPASDIVMKRARWLWEPGHNLPQTPLGELVIPAGREGAAKSQYTIWKAACVTLGTLPGELLGQPRNVIICAEEDSWEHTIVPRLTVAGADLARVFRVQVRHVASGSSYSLQLPSDNGLLEAEITRLDAALVVFDPLLSVLDGKLNTHRAADVRAALEPLAAIAHRTVATMLGLAHFAKTEGRDAASLISGSHAFKDVARAVQVLARDSEDTGVLSQPKNNLGRTPSLSLSYRIEAESIRVSDGWAEVPKFVLGEPTVRNVEDLLDTGRARAVAEARNFLREQLEGGPRKSKDIAEAASQHGIAPRTLDRARKELQITPEKIEETWYMRLPAAAAAAALLLLLLLAVIAMMAVMAVMAEVAVFTGQSHPHQVSQVRQIRHHFPARAHARGSQTGRRCMRWVMGYRRRHRHHPAIREHQAPLRRAQATPATRGNVSAVDRPGHPVQPLASQRPAADTVHVNTQRGADGKTYPAQMPPPKAWRWQVIILTHQLAHGGLTVRATQRELARRGYRRSLGTICYDLSRVMPGCNVCQAPATQAEAAQRVAAGETGSWSPEHGWQPEGQQQPGPPADRPAARVAAWH